MPYLYPGRDMKDGKYEIIANASWQAGKLRIVVPNIASIICFGKSSYSVKTCSTLREKLELQESTRYRVTSCPLLQPASRQKSVYHLLSLSSSISGSHPPLPGCSATFVFNSASHRWPRPPKNGSGSARGGAGRQKKAFQAPLSRS